MNMISNNYKHFTYIFFQLSGFMMTVKGLPSTYNKDLQESQLHMYEVSDIMEGIVQVATGVMSTLKVTPGDSFTYMV